MKRWLVVGVLWIGLLLPVTALGAAPPLWELGLRGGMNATGTAESYAAGELYLLRALPWRAAGVGGALASRLDLGGGYLESGRDHGSWLAAGIDLVWSPPGAALLECEIGIRPGWLSDHEYGRDHFGGGVQFASHAGVALHLNRLVVSYRFQHMSNASIYTDNDGLDLHLFGLGGRF